MCLCVCVWTIASIVLDSIAAVKRTKQNITCNFQFAKNRWEKNHLWYFVSVYCISSPLIITVYIGIYNMYTCFKTTTQNTKSEEGKKWLGPKDDAKQTNNEKKKQNNTSKQWANKQEQKEKRRKQYTKTKTKKTKLKFQTNIWDCEKKVFIHRKVFSKFIRNSHRTQSENTIINKMIWI